VRERILVSTTSWMLIGCVQGVDRREQGGLDIVNTEASGTPVGIVGILGLNL